MFTVPKANGINRSLRAINLPIFGSGASDFLDIVDDTDATLFAYLYHRCGSFALARTLLTEVYLSVLPRAVSLLWFNTVRPKHLFAEADRLLEEHPSQESDLDRIYMPGLYWMSETERSSAVSLHEALWSLRPRAQRLLTLSLLAGLSEHRIAEIEGATPDRITAELAAARREFLVRWQPAETLLQKLPSLIFVPSLSIVDETTMRTAIVNKYSSVRMRRYQWVIVAGFATVFANFIVASVFAFAVITEPSASLKTTSQRLASVDAALKVKRLEHTDADYLLVQFYKQTQEVARDYSTHEFNALGLSAAAGAAKRRGETDERLRELLRLLDDARTVSMFMPRASLLVAVAMNAGGL